MQRGVLKRIRRRPTLPHKKSCSTIGAKELNFRVRDGIGCGLLAITTGEFVCLNAGCSALLRGHIFRRLPPYSVESSSTYPVGTTAGTQPPCEHIRPNLYPLATAGHPPFRRWPWAKTGVHADTQRQNESTESNDLMIDSWM